jgi:regulatory protein
VTEEKRKARAKSLAFRYLSLRPRSRAELLGYLKKKELPEEAIEETIAALEGYGYIDDRKFAVGYGRYLIEQKGLSRYAVKAGLKRKGVGEEDIQPALETLGGEDFEDDLTVAIRVAEKKAASLKGVDKEKARRRLMDYLRRRGFSFDIVIKTIKNLD